MLSLKLILILGVILKGLECDDSINPHEYYDMIPSFEMNFKINLRWYYEDCYFIPLNTHDIIHAIVHVISGGDNTIDFSIFDPNKQLIESKPKSPFSWYDNSDIQIPGDYKICIRNLEHHEKKVYINFVSFSKTEITEKKNEAKNLNETHSYMSERLGAINDNIHSVRRSQILQRMIHSSDQYFIEANNEYVMYYSIIQGFVIILSGVIQTYFIKKLFEGPKQIKPRA
ncbi:unnamed protein product [Brachionus calyciflorus]|uniref:GOLD domain-containing protein n=1 Tax=Brachionus calyciflorus TaxID=104777 RepID=A0A814LZ07_9BILA|nr:unnamed protein product [Brachionus calyciflorus]